MSAENETCRPSELVMNHQPLASESRDGNSVNELESETRADQPERLTGPTISTLILGRTLVHPQPDE